MKLFIARLNSNSTANLVQILAPSPQHHQAFMMFFLAKICITGLAALAGIAASAPSPPHPWTFTPSTTSLHTCGASTFDQTAGLTPSNWRDCASLSSTWAAVNGSFRINPPAADVLLPILRYATCTLAVAAYDTTSLTIGDADLENILARALLGFSQGTLLTVQGVILCDAGEGRKGLQWQIYDSNDSDESGN